MTFEPYERMPGIRGTGGGEYSGKKKEFACCIARGPSRVQDLGRMQRYAKLPRSAGARAVATRPRGLGSILQVWEGRVCFTNHSASNEQGRLEAFEPRTREET